MEDNTKTIQKILLDSIMTVVREEIQKGRSADVVYATITGVDELGSFYRFTYNGHEYIGHSNLPNFSVGENVYVLFNGSQDENVILCGENVSDGSFNGNKYVTRVLTQYIISDNSTVVPSDDNANWKTGYEAQDSDKGRWVRTVTNYSDGSVEYSTPVYMTSGSNETAQDLSDFKQQYEKDKEALQGKVDSKINVYYSSEAPVGLKDSNVGDIWVDADNGKSQMWDGSKWVEFTTKVPPELLDQVDGKSTIYTTQPTVPYDKNDVWFNGNDIYVCTAARTSGEFDSADWARKETYAHQSTVDANNEAFQNFKNVTYSKDISDLRQKVTAQEQELTGNVDGTFISSLKTTVSEHEQKFDEIGNTISEKVNSMFTEKDGTTLSTFVDKVNAIKQTADGTQENYTKIQNTLNDNYFTKEESRNLITKTADGIKVEVDKNTEKIGYSISDVKTYYLQNDGTKPSADDSAWSLTAPERIAGQHIWTHTIVTLNSGTQVDKGIVDITGADGIAPTVSAERTGSGVEITITSSDGTTKTATLNDGAKGDQGPKGKDGRSSYVHFAYAQSEDGTVGFNTSAYKDATYIGVNYNYEEDDPTTPSSYSWSRLRGDTGPRGPQGEQGIAGATGATGATGPKGADGKTSYIHIKYAPSESPSDSQITDTPNAYIGVYTDQNLADSTKASAYTWSKWQGKDGARGIRGPQGADGKTTYVHFAYSDSADGKSNFNTNYFSGAFYVGTLTDYNPTDSTDYTAYTWSRLKGDKGDKGDTGPQGLQGLQGPKGDQGIQGKTGADGKTYYTHIAYAASADGKTGFSVSPTSNAKYLGMCVDLASADPTDPTKYGWTLIRGADGPQGIQGKAGADGKTPYVHFAYANSADGKTNFNVNYFSNALYVGTYTDYTSADSTNYSSYTWARLKGDTGDKGDKGDTGPQGPQGLQGLQGPKGDQGIQGKTGAAGATAYTHIAYATSADGSTGFSVSDSAGKTYIGMYVDHKSTDSTSPSAYRWTLIKGPKGDKGDKGDTGATGLQGIQGPKGDQGVPGKDGATGKTSYFHIKYSSVASPTSSSQMSETPSTYIGTYVDFTEADSTDPTKYTWSQFKGSQGAKGDQGIAGKNGADGKTSYLHIAYATSADGSTGFSTSDSAGKTYIGQYTDFVSADSTDRTKYAWTLIKGEKGDKGATGATGPTGPQGATGAKGADGISPTVSITKSGTTTTISITDKTGTHTQTVNDGTNGTPGAKGADGRTSYLHVKYSNDGGKTFTANGGETVGAYIGTCTDFNSADPTAVGSYTWAKIKGETGATGPKGATGPQGPQGLKGDTGATGPQGPQGLKGDQGIPGKAGADGRTPYLHMAYANSADGKTNFNVNYFSGALYVGTYTDYTQADSTNYSAYTWARLKGDTGATGPQGSSSYTHIAYGNVVFYDAVDDVSINGDTLVLSYKKTGKNITVTNDGSTLVFGDNGDRPFSATATTDGTLEFSYYTVNDFSTTDNSNRRWMGTCINETESAPSSPYAYTWTKIVGEGIKSTDITYQASSSQTTAPSGTWANSVPSLSASNPYLWTRTVITYTDNTTSTSYSVSSAITDARINSAIIKHEQEYYQSTSDTALSGGSWSTTFPARKDGTFYWVRYKDTHANNAVTYDPSANGKLLTEVNEVWNTVVSNKTAINSSNAQINMIATSVTSVETDLVKKANSDDVKSSMDGLSSTIADINKQVAELKVKASSIEASVTDVNNLAQTTQKATASLTTSGLSVDTNQTTKSVVDGTGLTITSKADNSVVAKFTTGESEIQNLKIDGYMKLGAHIVQKMQDAEWDGTIVNGTGWMWNGG